MNSSTLIKLAFLALGLAWVVAPTPCDALEYVVKDGDTLQALAQRFYGDARQWQRIADANGLGNGGTFRPGKAILIPEDGDPDNPGAVIVSVSGKAQVIEPVSSHSREAKVGAGLLWQQVFRTAKGAKAQLRVRDGAYLRVYGDTEFTMMGTIGDPLADEVIRLRIRMAGGAIELAAAEDARVRLEVLTDRGMAILDGGEIFFGEAPGGYRVATYRGMASFGRVRVGPGEGGVVSPSGSQQRVGPLLPAVSFKGGQPGALPILLSLGERAPAYVRWTALAGTKAFEAALFFEQDDEIVVETRTGPHASAVGFELPDSGIYRARVRPISELGVPGPWATLTFVGIKGSLVVPPFLSDDSGLIFIGSATLGFESMPAGLTAFVGVDERPTRMIRAGAKVVVKGTGEHSLNLRALLSTKPQQGGLDTEITASVPVRLEPIPGVEVTFTPPELNPLQRVNKVLVTVRLSDGADLPVLGESPRVSAGGRSCVAQPTGTDGQYRCELHPRVAPGLERLPLIVRGRGDSFVYRSEFRVVLPDGTKLKVNP